MQTVRRDYLLNLCQPRPRSGRGHRALGWDRAEERQLGNSPRNPGGAAETLHPLQASSRPGPCAALKSKLPDPLCPADQKSTAPWAARQQSQGSPEPAVPCSPLRALPHVQVPLPAVHPFTHSCKRLLLTENLTVLALNWASGKHRPLLVPHVCHPLPWEQSPSWGRDHPEFKLHPPPCS